MHSFLSLRVAAVAASRPLALHRCFSHGSTLLSGHNKWSKIKQKKGVADIKKSAIYGKAGRDIAVAIRSGGSPDPAMNATLANVLKKAKADGVPKENIDKALARATGGQGKDASQHVVYEAMVSGSVAVMIECMTDNGNRTIHKLREILNGYNARFAPVGFLFEKIGRVQVSVPQGPDRDTKIETMLDAASSAGGEDFDIVEDTNIVEYFCPTEALEAMSKAISGVDSGIEIVSSESIYRAKDTSEVDEELEGKVVELREDLEENEDCVRVWTTIDSRIRIDSEDE